MDAMRILSVYLRQVLPGVSLNAGIARGSHPYGRHLPVQGLCSGPPRPNLKPSKTLTSKALNPKPPKACMGHSENQSYQPLLRKW